MAGTTEAACLLQTGALYTRRLGLRPDRDGSDLLFLGRKHGAFSLYFGDAPIYHFDLEGRWQRAFVDGVHYLKGLDTSTVAIERVREGANMVLRRRPLRFAEAGDLDAAIRDVALDLLDRLGTGRLLPVEPPAPTPAIPVDDARDLLDRIARWDSAAWFAHRERYCATYGPISFLPPNCQNAVILQATAEGFGARTLPEFREHAGDVAALLGRRVLQCRGLFLAGGDLFRRPVDEIEGYLRIASETFPIEPAAGPRRLSQQADDSPRLDGIYTYLDEFAIPLPGPDDWIRFKEIHQRRVDLGLESGDPAARSMPDQDRDDGVIRDLVGGLKGAGIEVGVVILIGAGGVENAERHEAATAALVNALPIGPGDLVYLIDADEAGGPSARERLRERGLTPLDASGKQAQTARLKERLAPVRNERGAKVVPYSMEKQWT